MLQRKAVAAAVCIGVLCLAVLSAAPGVLAHGRQLLQGTCQLSPALSHQRQHASVCNLSGDVPSANIAHLSSPDAF
jgi:hypothetical protein